MPARKSGTSIYVEESLNTLSSVTADINDPLWIEESPAGTFTIKNKDLDIRDGGVLTIGDSGDYSVSEKLLMQPTQSTGCDLIIQLGGELQLFGNVEIDATTNPSYYNYWRFYGKFYVRGNVTYKPTIKHIYNLDRYYNSILLGDRNHDIYDIDYLRIINPFNTNSFYFSLQSIFYVADKGIEKWKNIECGEAGDASGYIIRAYYSYVKVIADDFSKILIESCKFQYANSYGINILSFPICFKNCLFANNAIGGMRIEYDLSSRGRVGGKSGDIPIREMDIQQFVFCDGCDFEDNGSYDVSLSYGASFLAKGCTFNHSPYAIWTATESRTYIWSGNTFNGTYGAYVGSQSFVFWVHALDLTVKSKETGNPLADAMVYIRQKDGKEKWLFKTDANGRPINMSALDGKVILIWKEQLNAAGTSWDLWSDPSNSTYHEIWVWKEGYEPHKLTYTMEQDRQVTVELEDALLTDEVKDGVPFGLGLTGIYAPVCDFPSVNDVEKGVTFDEGEKVGTFKVPLENDIRKDSQYGGNDNEFTGQLNLPSEDDVEDGVKFDSETKEGNFVAPAEDEVKKDVGYGSQGSEFLGTLEPTTFVIAGQNLEGKLQAKTNLVGTLQKKVNMVGIIQRKEI